MKILTGQQIKQADLFTIENEPVSSIELMERASESIAREICELVQPEEELLFVIGKGNNGGDGMAVARILHNAGFRCLVSMLHSPENLSEECRFNFERLPEGIPVTDNSIIATFEGVIIDAVLGSGVQDEPRSPEADAIRAINASPSRVISIDLPSGMKTEFGNNPDQIVHADTTLTIQFPKLAMLLPQAGGCAGEIKVVDIELDSEFMGTVQTPYNYITADLISGFRKDRLKFSNKGNYGHALLICGSKGMAGAAILSTTAVLRSGCGLVTTHLPYREATAIHASAPSAMVSHDRATCFTSLPKDLEKYDVCGCGPGLGMKPDTETAVERLMLAFDKPLVLDADALNVMAAHSQLKKMVPAGSVLTPHPGEFKRLVGEWSGEEEKIRKSVTLAEETGAVVVLKDAVTMIATPDGHLYFNTSGNPGMAKGGSGDVLTGFITGLMARGYSNLEASLMGVYLHGRAGDKAAEYYGQEGMNSSDIVDFLAEALQELF